MDAADRHFPGLCAIHTATPPELRLDSRLQFDDLQAIADAAVAGVGLACLPCWMMAPHIRSGELQWILCGERLLAAEIHAVWPQTRHLPSKTRAAIDALVQQVPAVLEAARDFRTRR